MARKLGRTLPKPGKDSMDNHNWSKSLFPRTILNTVPLLAPCLQQDKAVQAVRFTGGKVTSRGS